MSAYMPRAAPTWLRPVRRIGTVGAAKAVSTPIQIQYALTQDNNGSTVRAARAVAGSTLMFIFPSGAANVTAQSTAGVSGTPSPGTDSNGNSTITLVLDGNPGTVTASWQGGQYQLWQNFVVTLTGSQTVPNAPPNAPPPILPGQPIQVPQAPKAGGTGPTPTPGGGSSTAAAAASSSTGTIVAVVGGVLVAGGAAWWFYARPHRRNS